ncbi:MAG: DUF692 family protein [Lewinellaceae bacterium]|nr:DUF692 family protein [Lewinellaceae bacterium]
MIPELGVGISYCAGLDPLLAAQPDLFPVVEIEPQTFWVKSREGKSPFRVYPEVIQHLLDLPGRKLIHSVAAPVGGTVPADAAQFQMLREMVQLFKAPYLSEHLSFNQAHGYHTGFFLPPRQTRSGVQVAADAVRRLQDAIGVPIAIETGVSYFKSLPDEMPDGAFVAEVAAKAQCGILLDLHNVYTNARNGRQSVTEFVRYLPLDQVWEVHMAGGMERNGYYLDSHSGEMETELLEISAQVIAQLPNLKAMIYEIFPSFIETAGLDCVARQMESLHGLWEKRATAPRAVPALTVWSNAPEQISPEDWENNIAALVNHHADSSLAPKELQLDPCIPVVRQLIEEFRASMLVGLYPLSARLLMLMMGKDIFRSLLEDFWSKHAPQQYAAVEVEQFGAYLRSIGLEIPSLAAVLNFEEAAMHTMMDGTARTVSFDFDPLPLLRSLAEGTLPDMESQLGDYAITLTGEGVELLSSLEKIQAGLH